MVRLQTRPTKQHCTFLIGALSIAIAAGGCQAVKSVGERLAGLGDDIIEFIIQEGPEKAYKEFNCEFVDTYQQMFVAGGAWPIDSSLAESKPDRITAYPTGAEIPLRASGRGDVSRTFGQDLIWIADCSGFERMAREKNLDWKQESRNTCWAACAEMVLEYTGEDPDVDQYELVQAVKGGQIDTAPGDDNNNQANAYEVAKALNPDLIGESDEFLVVTKSAKAVAEFESEEDLLDAERMRLVQRMLAQFMGAGEIARSIAEGEPVIVGLINTKNDSPNGELLDSAHAWVLHRVEFSFLPPEDSRDIHLEVLRAMSDLIVRVNSEGEGDIKQQTLEDELRDYAIQYQKIKDRLAYGISIEKVYLIDPFDYASNPGYEELENELSGDEFGRRLIYSLNRERARKIIPLESPALPVGE